MNKTVAMEDIIPLIKEQIEKDGEVTFTPKGNSMFPMLRNNKDTVTIEKAVFPLKKYQIPLYVRENGAYVLHRVVKVEKDGYVMRGDNQFMDEHGITEAQIIGVVSRFTRKNKTYYCNAKSYILYYKIWINTVSFRKYLRVLRRFAGKVKRKIIRVFR